MPADIIERTRSGPISENREMRYANFAQDENNDEDDEEEFDEDEDQDEDEDF